ncbi:XRE family transcriptional regulator [Nocardia panacis]|uniref:XRE family transcriptional regulator n=1 Tax=Nocardia panacis TaxID=2340916 RepID=A0A3A4JU45_9NOCA|nr:XRE family transcriptional regulator [Nocardia panacis]
MHLLLGARLRRMRQDLDIKQQAAGAAIYASASKISRLETGLTSITETDARNLLRLYHVPESEQAQYLTWVRQVNAIRGFTEEDSPESGLDALLDFGSVATLRRYEHRCVPDILQTEQYACAASELTKHLGRPGEVEQAHTLRLERRAAVLGAAPPTVWLMIEDSALRRRIGGTAVWRAQIAELIDLTRLRHIIIQIIPDDAHVPAFCANSFTILRFRDPDMPDVVCLHQLTGTHYLSTTTLLPQFQYLANHISTLAPTPTHSRTLLESLLREDP